MRDPNRIETTLKQIERIWKKYPDLRLGQLLCNVANYGALYYVEDNVLLELLQHTYGRIEEEVETDKEVEEAKEVKSNLKDRVYIHKGEKIKAVYKNELESYFADGWRKGRKDK